MEAARAHEPWQPLPAASVRPAPRAPLGGVTGHKETGPGQARRDTCGEGQCGQLSPVPAAAGVGGAVTAPPGTQGVLLPKSVLLGCANPNSRSNPPGPLAVRTLAPSPGPTMAT